ncbi:MAG: tetratricopeptide repeat protein [Pedobacter sp.]|nr:tetratricopeptide repeat protein [Pedobacter sp.]
MEKKLFGPGYGKIVGLALLLMNVVAQAQVKTPQQKLDSILSADQRHPKEDSVKLVIYKSLYRQYIRLKKLDKANEYIDKSIVLAKRLGQHSLEGDAYNRKALGYHGVANYQKAEEFYLLALNSFSAANNTDMVAGMYLNMGALYQGIPDYAKALTASQKAIDIYQKNGNESDLASVYTNVAGIYKDLGQSANALNYLDKALKIFVKEEVDRGIAVVYNTIGSTYIEASDAELAKIGIKPNQKYERALDYLNKGLKVGLALDDASVLGPLYRDLGALYEKTGKRNLALPAYDKALGYANAVTNKTDLGTVLLALANFYVQDKNYAKAETLLNDALRIGDKDQTLEIQRNAYLLLSEVAEKQGKFNLSLENYKKYITYRDQIFNTEKEREITRKQLQIDFAVKEKDYQLKQQVTNAELQRQFLLAKQREQQLVLSDQEKSIQRLSFLKRQADLENEKRFQTNLLHQQQLKAKLDKEINDKQLALQQSELRFNKNINIILGILAVMLFTVGLFVFYSQRKTAKLNRLVSEQKQQLEKLGMVKDRIFSVVSHDMRAPVNSLIAFIQLLEGGNISQEKLTKYASNLKNTLGYTSAMMENLLNWASSQMQGFKPVIEKFDVRSCTQEVINSMEAIANEKDIVIKNEVAPSIFCYADQNMSALILRNLLSNAIKFTPNKGLIVVNADFKTDQIYIAINDTGIGLSAQQVMEINQNGVQDGVKSTLGTNKEKGTGIGLVLCKTFVAMMNGSLSVQSEANGGSRFTLSLPKAAA